MPAEADWLADLRALVDDLERKDDVHVLAGDLPPRGETIEDVRARVRARRRAGPSRSP